MDIKRVRELAGILNETFDADEEARFAQEDVEAEKRQAAIEPHMSAVSQGIENAIITLVNMGMSEEDARDSVLEDVRYMMQTF